MRVGEKIYLSRGLVGADIGIRPQGSDLLRLQPLPLRVRQDDVRVDALGGLPAAGTGAAGGCLPGADPGGGQLPRQGLPRLSGDQIGMAQPPPGHALFQRVHGCVPKARRRAA